MAQSNPHMHGPVGEAERHLTEVIPSCLISKGEHIFAKERYWITDTASGQIHTLFFIIALHALNALVLPLYGGLHDDI